MKNAILLLSISLILASCTTNSPPTMEPKILASTPASAEVVAPAPANFLSECLPPIETFEYKFGEVPFDFDWSEVTAITLPPVAWQKTTNIPDASSLTLIQSQR